VDGDLLSSHDGNLHRVQAIVATQEVATVYNVEIESYHTYFVGGVDWGFSVWAHNAGQAYGELKATKWTTADGETTKADAIAQRLAQLQRQGVKLPWPIIEQEFGPISHKATSALRNDAEQYGYQRTGAKRGPREGANLDDNAEHNFLVAVLSESLPEGHRIIAGGRFRDGSEVRPEVWIPTGGGFKSNRRPDIWVEAPDGSRYVIQVGLALPNGQPIPRERAAILDFTQRAKMRVQFYAYGVGDSSGPQI
jgi:hypothetical protein